MLLHMLGSQYILVEKDSQRTTFIFLFHHVCFCQGKAWRFANV